jgi:hypothetical protein
VGDKWVSLVFKRVIHAIMKPCTYTYRPVCFIAAEKNPYAFCFGDYEVHVANLDTMIVQGKLPASILQISDDTGAATTISTTAVIYAASVSTATNITAIYVSTVAPTAITTAATNSNIIKFVLILSLPRQGTKFKNCTN